VKIKGKTKKTQWKKWKKIEIEVEKNGTTK